MVGVPRSTGCRICVQRRVKCDGTRPTCKNCAKGGRPCPGYNAEVIFRDEGPKLKWKHAIQEQVDEHNVQSPLSSMDSFYTATSSGFVEHTLGTNSPANLYEHQPDTVLLGSSYPPVAQGSAQPVAVDEWSHTARTQSRQHVLSLYQIHAPILIQKQLLHAFSEAIAPTTKGFLPSAMKTQNLWFRHLPDLSGSDVLLDTAIRAVTLMQIGRQYQLDNLMKEAMPHYGTALVLLRRTLNTTSSGLGNKTLCATALLSIYEMFASSDNSNWIGHAGGVGALMRQRGAARHRYGFDRDILRAYRYTLAIEAFQRGEPCFLDEPEWRKVLADIHDDIQCEGLIPEDQGLLFDTGEEFFAHLTRSTTVCAQANKLRQSGSPHTSDQIQAYMTSLRQLKRNRQALQKCNLTFEKALTAAGKMPKVHISNDSVFPVYYEHDSLFMSIFYMGHRSTLAVVNWHILRVANTLVQQNIIQASMLSELNTENLELSVQMCQSVPDMLNNSFLGPFFAVFGLRFASHVFDRGGPEWNWTIDKLLDIADRYLLMARHLPWYSDEAGDQPDLDIAIYRGRQYQNGRIATL